MSSYVLNIFYVLVVVLSAVFILTASHEEAALQFLFTDKRMEVNLFAQGYMPSKW